jgi:hypothetical protein
MGFQISKLGALGYSIFEINEHIAIARNDKNIYIIKDDDLACDFQKEFTELKGKSLGDMILNVYRVADCVYIGCRYYSISIYIDSSNNVLITNWLYEDKNIWLTVDKKSVFYYNKRTGYKKRVEKENFKQFGECLATEMDGSAVFMICDDRYLLSGKMVVDLYGEESLVAVRRNWYADFIGFSFYKIKGEKNLWFEFVYVYGKGIYRVLEVGVNHITHEVEVTYIDGFDEITIKSFPMSSDKVLNNHKDTMKKFRTWNSERYVNSKGQTDEMLNIGLKDYRG